jgi:hypothetical protein
MNNATKDCLPWSRGRFLSVVGVLFVLQVGLILLFGDHSRMLPPLSAPSVRFRALGASVGEDQLVRQFFVGDPAVFPLANAHGFSGQGWLEDHPLSYKDTIQLEPKIWLNLDTARLGTDFPLVPSSVSRFVSGLVARLGTNFPDLPSSSEPTLSGLAEQRTQHEEPLPVFLMPEIIPTQSLFRLGGGLNDRLLGGTPKLRSWTSEKLLASSVVKIAVDPVGEVVAAKLEASCGLAEADADAVAKARALRFHPSSTAGTQWGDAVFQWQTSAQDAVNQLK